MLIPLPCGGHITPPVLSGPTYHYHKAADCEKIQEPGEHGPLIGYAADGFGIYGLGDYWGMPVLDECHGHFGTVPNSGVRFDFGTFFPSILFFRECSLLFPILKEIAYLGTLKKCDDNKNI